MVDAFDSPEEITMTAAGGIFAQPVCRRRKRTPVSLRAMAIRALVRVSNHLPNVPRLIYPLRISATLIEHPA
jgi:hypothetical protein